MRDLFDKYGAPVFWALLFVLATWGTWEILTTGENVSHVWEEGQKSVQQTDIPPAVMDQPILEEVSADGKVRWTLYLDRIVREQGSLTELSKPRALYRLESGEVLEVTGNSGSYDEEKGILTLVGDVKGWAREAGFQFSVDKVVWESSRSSLIASGHVQLTKGGISFSGEELRLELGEGLTHLEITGGVKITGTSEVLSGIGLPE